MSNPPNTALPDAHKVIRVYQYDTKDKEIITVAGTAIGFTAGTILPSDATRMKRAFCTLEGAPIRFWANGDDPTTSEGHLLGVGQILEIGDYDTLYNFRAIRTGTVSGTLMCSFET
jgi:hypothetical protein